MSRKALGGEIASGLRVALQRHQHMGQGTAEQFRVEEIVSFLKSPVLGWCDRFFRGDFLFHDAVSLGQCVCLYRTIQTEEMQEVSCNGVIMLT